LNFTEQKIFEYLKEKKIALLGFAKSNQAVAEFLDKISINFQVRDKKICDSKIKFKNSKIEFIFGESYLENLDCDLIFRTPGIRPDLIKNKNLNKNLILLSEIEFFLKFCPTENLIAVTGSDGKSTTTSLIYELLKNSCENNKNNKNQKVFLGGNIGTPILPQINKISDKDFVVLELSSFQLITCDINPKIAVITNISENHLDWHKNFQEYINSKINIFKNQTRDNLLVTNFDCDILNNISKKSAGKKRFFSIKSKVSNGCCLDNQEYIIFCENNKNSRIIHKNEIKIPGRHNIENFMAAISACYDFINIKNIKYIASNFKNLAHRIEFVTEINGVCYYDDSIASTPNRVIKGAFSVFENNNIILIAGGYDKNLSFEKLAEEICDKIKILILIGQTAEKIKNCVLNCQNLKKPEIFIANSMQSAVNLAYKNSLKNNIDTVLLSPACASFGMYSNFEERGNDFKNHVLNLKKIKNFKK